MKKFKSIHELQEEKERNFQHQRYLEVRMKNNWYELKEYMKPGNIAKEMIAWSFFGKSGKRPGITGFLKNIFSFTSGW